LTSSQKLSECCYSLPQCSQCQRPNPRGAARWAPPVVQCSSSPPFRRSRNRLRFDWE
jgi:hypothetical protein